ncbi:Phytochrome-like protein cph2 [compost metagenome]
MQLNKDFIDKLIDICQKNNTSPSSIEIEITEGMLIDLHNNKIEILNEIIKRGIKIAVDDFGKGYSSLTYLTALPINTLKIDKSFIDNIHINKYKAVVKCIIDLCKSLEYRIVAEGVEEKKQLDILNELGCNVIQGYYYSKPLFEHEMEGFNLDGIAK